MTRLIKQYKTNFTFFNNDIFKDKRLSYKELGLLCQMMSLPDHWEFSVRGLASLHSDGKINNTQIYEAGHPISDENTIKATRKAIEVFSKLDSNDIVIFLLSGGASALFEDNDIGLEQLQVINNQMLKKGLNIEEINTIRKKLSNVKGGKFAHICKPQRSIH